jgi:hypothetical protein
MNEPKIAKRLAVWQECAGTVDGLRSEDGILIADLSGHLVALPEELEAELNPYLGKRIAILRTDTDYRVRELQTIPIEYMHVEVHLPTETLEAIT